MMSPPADDEQRLRRRKRLVEILREWGVGNPSRFVIEQVWTDSSLSVYNAWPLVQGHCVLEWWDGFWESVPASQEAQLFESSQSLPVHNAVVV
jgi:hypothetical protein